MEKEYWRGKSYAFFCNKACEYFPCHTTDDEDNFNCLFCYCPLYALGSACGGTPSYMENGIKNCSNCTLPHEKENYGLLMKSLKSVVDNVRSK